MGLTIDTSKKSLGQLVKEGYLVPGGKGCLWESWSNKATLFLGERNPKRQPKSQQQSQQARSSSHHQGCLGSRHQREGLL